MEAVDRPDPGVVQRGEDLGLARLIKTMAPSLHVHGSTQMTLKEIMLGMAVASGNDAAAAAAIHTAGSVAAFVERMNAEAQSLGLFRTHFVDPSGYSEFNLTTAQDFAAFCRA